MLYASACILVIDDDPDIREILRLSLEREGYRVILAATGIEALHKLMDKEPCDLLLLDIVLPDIDGWTILSRLRAAPITARIPIIMMTANSDTYNETELLAAGADDYVSKPFLFDNLLAHIQALLRRAALQTINPLTGLPGNRQVERFLQQCVKETTKFWAAAYIDIDNFKAYNDCYGFLQGDEVLKATAGAITRAAQACSHSVFIGNIGGDDFLIGFSNDLPRADEEGMTGVKAALESLVIGFDGMVRDFYSAADLERGYLEAESRRGGVEHYPLMSLSIAVVTNVRRLFNHPLEISNAFA